MPTQAMFSQGTDVGVIVAELPLADPDPFTRADLVFYGVDHSGPSYEVRAFLNNPEATWLTPRDEENGYGGRFTVFGHGGCYGEEGHCDIPEITTDPYDLRPPHPLVPHTKIVTVTRVLRRILEQDPNGLRTVTLVPIAVAATRAERAPADDLFRFDRLELQTYLSDVEADAEPIS